MASESRVQRQGWRLVCGDKCVLHRNGMNTECVLLDISVSGVLVKCDEEFAETLQPGDTCSIFLCGDPLVCQSEVVCTVVRRDENRIGLRFPPGI